MKPRATLEQELKDATARVIRHTTSSNALRVVRALEALEEWESVIRERYIREVGGGVMSTTTKL